MTNSNDHIWFQVSLGWLPLLAVLTHSAEIECTRRLWWKRDFTVVLAIAFLLTKVSTDWRVNYLF